MKKYVCILAIVLFTTSCGKPKTEKTAPIPNESEESAALMEKFQSDISSGKFTLITATNPDETDPVIEAINDCHSKPESVTTSGRLSCSEIGVNLYLEKITKLNNMLLEYSTNSEKKLISTAQSDWLTYLQSQMSAVNNVQSNVRGTMFTESASYSELALYKQRYEDLNFLVELKQNALCPAGECG